MSSSQVKAAQDTLTNVSYKELRRRGTVAKSGCVTKDEDGGETYDPDATSYPMFLAAKNEAARRYEIEVARGGTELSRPDEETFDEKEGWSDKDTTAHRTDFSRNRTQASPGARGGAGRTATGSNATITR